MPASASASGTASAASSTARAAAASSRARTASTNFSTEMGFETVLTAGFH